MGISWHASGVESLSKLERERERGLEREVERENLQKRCGLESCTWRLIVESDQPSSLHVNGIRCSLCLFHFHRKGHSCHWLQMGARIPNPDRTVSTRIYTQGLIILPWVWRSFSYVIRTVIYKFVFYQINHLISPLIIYWCMRKQFTL